MGPRTHLLTIIIPLLLLLICRNYQRTVFCWSTCQPLASSPVDTPIMKVKAFCVILFVDVTEWWTFPQDHMILVEFLQIQIEMWWMERLSRRGIRHRRKCTGERFSWCTSTKTTFGSCVHHTCLLCCSLHPGDLFPFTRKPLFIIVDSSNSTAYKVGRKQEVGHTSSPLSSGSFPDAHHCHHQVPPWKHVWLDETLMMKLWYMIFISYCAINSWVDHSAQFSAIFL